MGRLENRTPALQKFRVSLLNQRSGRLSLGEACESFVGRRRPGNLTIKIAETPVASQPNPFFGFGDHGRSAAHTGSS